MSKRSANHGKASPRKDPWWVFHGVRAVLVAGAIPAILVAACVFHEVRFYWLTDPASLTGKTVSQIVGRLGLPDEEIRDSDDVLFAATTLPLSGVNPLHHTYGPNEHFNGLFLYLNFLGDNCCRIDIRNGVATQVLYLPNNERK